MRRLIVDLAITTAVLAAASVKAAQWQVFDDCHYVTNAANDGDSFHVTCKDKPYLFRLYFVDTPETDTSLGQRIDEQAKYFHISSKQTVEIGKMASQFTREKLGGKFSVRTCFQDALGRSKMERFYAIVQTTSGDLGEQLIENGLARIHGASANPAGLPRANVEWQKLQKLERDAKSEKVGAWGVVSGRMLAQSAKAKNRPATDPFDAFFHPDRGTEADGTRPQSSFEAFFHRKKDEQGTTTEFGVRARSTTAAPAPTATATIAPSAAVVVAPEAAKTGKIDINTATEEELTTIPGIGPILAARIMAYRPFKSADDLRHVKGIGDVRYGKMRPYFD